MFSDDGRYLAGLKIQSNKSASAWVLDTRNGRIVRRKRVPYSDDYEIDWRRNRFEFRTYGGEKPLAALRPR
ncbi:MAG TPA: hypothetical protein VGE01_02175 [Fimbriimonas sp.]